MNEHVHATGDLTKNQSLVMGTLNKARGPLSAYTILDQLRDHGFRAPLQVYRALDKLVEYGLVHRLESLNAFVACSHAECESHGQTAFTICQSCGDVTELADDDLAGQLKSLAARSGFTVHRSTVELRGLCRDCTSN